MFWKAIPLVCAVLGCMHIASSALRAETADVGSSAAVSVLSHVDIDGVDLAPEEIFAIDSFTGRSVVLHVAEVNDEVFSSDFGPSFIVLDGEAVLLVSHEEYLQGLTPDYVADSQEALSKIGRILIARGIFVGDDVLDDECEVAVVEILDSMGHVQGALVLIVPEGIAGLSQPPIPQFGPHVPRQRPVKKCQHWWKDKQCENYGACVAGDEPECDTVAPPGSGVRACMEAAECRKRKEIWALNGNTHECYCKQPTAASHCMAGRLASMAAILSVYTLERTACLTAVLPF